MSVQFAPVSIMAPQPMRSPTRATALPFTNVALAPVSTVPAPCSGQSWAWPIRTMDLNWVSFYLAVEGLARTPPAVAAQPGR